MHVCVCHSVCVLVSHTQIARALFYLPRLFEVFFSVLVFILFLDFSLLLCCFCFIFIMFVVAVLLFLFLFFVFFYRSDKRLALCICDLISLLCLRGQR